MADLNTIQDGHRWNVLCYCIDIYVVRKHSFVYLNMHNSPGNEVIVDHWKRTKMLTKVFQRNLTPWGYVEPPIKPHPNPPWGKPRFWVKSKMDRH